MTSVGEVLQQMFDRGHRTPLFEPMQQTPAELQANLHESYTDLLHTVHSCEAWQRIEDRIDAAIRGTGGW